VAVALVIIPFFLSYSDVPSFWLKTNTYREQPRIEYEYKIIGILEGYDESGMPFEILYSSMSSISSIFARETQNSLRVPVLRSLELDKNRDGITDQFSLEALIPLQQGEKIHSTSVMAFFNVRLKRKARLEMETLAYAHADSAMPGRAAYFDGDFLLLQKWPLRVKGGYQLPYENTPLIPTSNVDAQSILFPRLLAAYRARNNSMHYNQMYTVWSPRAGKRDDYASSSLPDSFNFTLNMRVPIAQILYTPPATEVFKDAWLKYLSLFIVIAFLLDRLCSFVFYNQLLDTTMCIETPYSQAGEPVKPT